MIGANSDESTTYSYVTEHSPPYASTAADLGASDPGRCRTIPKET